MKPKWKPAIQQVLPTSTSRRIPYTFTPLENAPTPTEQVSQYQSRGLFGARDFDTYVWNLPIPTYDENNVLHQKIVALTNQCETHVSGLDLSDQQFQKARKTVREHLRKLGILDELKATVQELFESQP